MLESAARLGAAGWSVTELPVQPDGLIDLDMLGAAVTPQTALVSIMAANNEIGVVQPLAEIGAIVRNAGALFHVDAAQGTSKVPTDVEAMRIDLLALTGHKIYGTQGNRRCALRAQAHGADAADSRRRPGARPAIGHAQRAGDCQPRPRLRNLPR